MYAYCITACPLISLSKLNHVSSVMTLCMCLYHSSVIFGGVA